MIARQSIINAAEEQGCRWCADGQPEWSPYAKVWIHRRDRLDRRCEKPPSNPDYCLACGEFGSCLCLGGGE
jgi:hypothetical protein